MNIRCAIYARISTKDRGQDAENQLIQLREFAVRQEWIVITEYVDEMSGGSAGREQFQQMFKDASRRRFDVLVFWSLDRLSREGAFPTLQYLTHLSDYGVQWRSFTEQYLDSTGMFRDAVIGILAAVAKQEKIRISERTKAGLERARQKGRVLGRPRANVDCHNVSNLRAEGLSWAAIADRTGHSRATCQRAYVQITRKATDVASLKSQPKLRV